jgi:molybdenum cofactor synthesis domain-containing protein
MKILDIEKAVGHVLAHDMTKIVPGEFKGVKFKKGHIIKEEDIDKFKDMGKYNVYVLELDENTLHEDDASKYIAKNTMGKNISINEPSEGKITFSSTVEGLLKIDVERLKKVNSVDNVIVATLHNNTIVKKEQAVAATRIIPLTIEKNALEKMSEYCDKKIISVKEFKKKKVGIVVTGTEVFEGRIKDKFGPILENKIKHYGGQYMETIYAPDSKEKISEAIMKHIDSGCEIVLTSGGMSVDPDDVTPSSIKEVAKKVVTYGAPVLPGAMVMVGYRDNVSILGIPGCGMYHSTTVFDLVYPRMLADDEITREEISGLGHGGLCMKCETCMYPICPLGK